MLGVLACTRVAAADDAPACTHCTRFDPRALRYTANAPKNYLRASIEEVAVLGAGLAQYFDTTGNSADWDLDYSWDSFSKKVTGDAIAFDTNRFDTNWVTHPAAGWLYYVAARGNRLSVAESFLFALASSTLWEYLGEFREQVSINDMIATPITGMAVGEVLTQLGSHFDHGGTDAGHQLLAWVFATSNKLHDTIDGASPDLTPRDRGWRELSLSLGAGTTTQSTNPGAHLDTTASLESRIFRAPRYRSSGDASQWLGDGNVSSLQFSTTLSEGEVADALFSTRFAFIGWYHQHARELGLARIAGNSTFAGADVGFRYSLHDYDRKDGGATDRLAQVDVLGLTFDQWIYLGRVHLHLALEASADFSGVTSLATLGYEARHGQSTLPSVQREQSYYFGGGATLAPSLSLHWGPTALRADARYSQARSIPGFDRTHAEFDEAGSVDVDAALGLHLTTRTGPFELGFSGVRRLRASRIRDFSRDFSETTLTLRTALVF